MNESSQLRRLFQPHVDLLLTVAANVVQKESSDERM